VQAIFAKTVDLPDEDRESYLARVCAGRPDLFSEVKSLLEANLKRAVAIKVLPDALAPDGRRFLMMKEGERHDAAQIVVILNWAHEVTRLVAAKR